MQDFLRLRRHNEHVDVNELEKRLGNVFPPVFKSFISNFKWSDSLEVDSVFVSLLKPGIGDMSLISNSIEDLISFTKKAEHPEVDERKGVFLFRSMNGVFVSTKSNEADKIYAKTLYSEKFECVAENVFEFLKGISTNAMLDCKSESEYRDYLIQSGFDDSDIEEEMEQWRECQENTHR